MRNLPKWTLSQQSRDRMNELLKSASELGLDPDAVALGGLAALRALMALKRAKDAGEGVRRDDLIAQAQEAASRLDPGAHADLLQQIQGRILALRGRNGDTEIAHVTPGEIVLPKALQTPAVLGALREAAVAAKIPLDQLRIGSAANSINPETGAPEFYGAQSVELPMEEIVIRSNLITDDPSTNEVIKGLHPSIRYDAAKFINTVKDTTGQQLRIPVPSGTRTIKEQDELFAQGRTAPGTTEKDVVTYAPGGKSYHNYGLAFDIVSIDGKNVIRSFDPASVAATGKEHGFEWGGDWSGRKKDRPHFQRTYGYTTDQLQQMTEPGAKYPTLQDQRKK